MGVSVGICVYAGIRMCVNVCMCVYEFWSVAGLPFILIYDSFDLGDDGLVVFFLNLPLPLALTFLPFPGVFTFCFLITFGALLFGRKPSMTLALKGSLV